MNMSVKQIARALNSLGEFTIKFDSDTGAFYVYVECVQISDRAGESSLTSERFTTPILAIRDYWKRATSLKPNQRLRIEDETYVRWNGFMWEVA